MVKIIETNISIDDEGSFADHQSRAIEVKSWDSFVEEIKNGDFEIRKSYLGHMEGSSIPRQGKIENFKSDDFHLSCDVYNYANVLTKKLCYLINE